MASASGVRAGRAYVEIGAKDKLSASLRKAQAQVKRFGQSSRQVGKNLALVGGAGSLGFGVITKIFASFDDQMRKAQAVTQATANEFAQLTSEAKRLGRETSFTASQVAAGMTELGRAGFNPREILDATEQILGLARATDTELARSAEIAGASLRGFGLPADQMARVADALTSAVNGSAQTMEDLFEAMKPVAPLAAQTGTTIEETAAAVGILANAGLKGSLAGNKLARLFKNLTDPLKQAKLGELGIEAFDGAGNLRPVIQILKEVEAVTGQLGTGERLGVLEELFGRGQVAAAILTKNTGAVEQFTESIMASGGAAVDTAALMEAGIGGAFRRLISAVEGIAIAIGDAIEGPVSAAAKKLTELAGVIRKLVAENEGLVRGFLYVTVGTLAAGAALFTMGVAAASLSAIFGLAAGVVTAFVTIVKLVAIAAVAAGAPLLAIGAIVAALAVAVGQAAGIWTMAIDATGAAFSRLGTLAGEGIGAMKAALADGDIRGALTVMKFTAISIVSSMWASIKNLWFRAIDRLKFGISDIGIMIEFGLSKALVRAQNVFIKFAGFMKGVADTVLATLSGIPRAFARAVEDAKLSLKKNTFLISDATYAARRETIDSARAEADAALAQTRGNSKQAIADETARKLGVNGDVIDELSRQQANAINGNADTAALREQERQARNNADQNRIQAELSAELEKQRKDRMALAMGQGGLRSGEIADRPETRVNDLQSLADLIGEGVSDAAEAAKYSTRGTFSGFRLSGFGSLSRPIERTAAAAEKLVEVATDIRQEVASGNGSMLILGS